MFLQSLRMTLRDWRAGELRFLLVALVVAVAALSSVGFFVDRMRAGLERDAHKLLGADFVIRADQPVPAIFSEEARRRGLRLASTAIFPSMAAAGEGMQAVSRLASVKAVSAEYPLRGRVKVATRAGGAGRAQDAIPQPGTVWADPAILASLHLAVGGTLKLGEKAFTVAGVITAEPDRGAGFVNFAPRVMMAAADLPATGLIQYGSRVTYRLLVAGDTPALQAYAKWVRQHIATANLRGVGVESLETGRPEMRATLQRAQEFLALVGLLSAMLAAVAVAMAARRFMLRHVDACAMLRCLGMTQSEATRLFLVEFLLVGLAGSVIGVVLGFGAHFVLAAWLGRLVTHDLPPASLLPAAQATMTGLLLLAGFAMPPILQLRNVPHNRVVRREQAMPQPATAATYALGTLVFLGLLFWQAEDAKLAALTGAGFIGGLAAFALIAWLALRSLRVLHGLFRRPSWRFAVTALRRRSGAAMLQVVALALGLMALLLLTVIRGNLVDAWRAATPPDTPNRFVINIQPDQKDAVAARLNGIDVRADLYPMIRGRLVAINGVPVNGRDFADQRARRLVEREFNLSTMKALPPANQVVAGRWFDDSRPAASVEAGLAKTLHLKLGDRLRFDVAGETVEAPITSLRKLEWGSMKVNFFVIINPAAMRDMPLTWITSFHLPPAQSAFDDALVRDFPNLTVVDIGLIVRQIRGMIDQVVTAVEFLFLFTLASGMLVLYAALAASQEQRRREAALLRALGATRRQLSRAQWIEFALIGGLAGLLAAAGASAVGWSLAHFVFDFDWWFSPEVWIVGAAAGAACALAGGWAGLRDVLNHPPLQTLREA